MQYTSTKTKIMKKLNKIEDFWASNQTSTIIIHKFYVFRLSCYWEPLISYFPFYGKKLDIWYLYILPLVHNMKTDWPKSIWLLWYVVFHENTSSSYYIQYTFHHRKWRRVDVGGCNRCVVCIYLEMFYLNSTLNFGIPPV